MKQASKRRLWVGLVLGIGLLALVSAGMAAHAAPACPFPAELRQADGTVISVLNRGDEFFSWQEDADGNVVAFDEGSDNWCYAAIEGGEIVPGAEPVGARRPAGGRRLRAGDLAPLLARVDRSAGKAIPGPGDMAPPAFRGAAGEPEVGESDVPPIAQSQNRQALLVLLVEYNNQAFNESYGDANTYWSNHFFNTTGKTVNNYYAEVSGTFNLQYIKPTFTSAAAGVKTTGLPSGVSRVEIRDGVARVKLNKNHPNTTDNSLVKPDIKLAFDAVKGYINFSDYPRRSGGYICTDYFTVASVVAGYDASAAGSAGFNKVWGHASYSFYSTDNPFRYLSIGGAGRNYTSVTASMTLATYTTQGELYNSAPTPMPLGVTVHELGHILGLPDLYSYDSMPAPRQGIGNYSVMASGSWGTDSLPGSADTKAGNTPTHPDAWCKLRLGFAAAETATPSAYTKIDMKSVGNGYNVLKIAPAAGGGQYFVVENRQPAGYDRGLGVTTGGILIWHVDEAPFGVKSDSKPNDNNGHKGLELEKLYAGISSATQNNPFYVLGGRFDATSTPNSNFHTSGHTSNPTAHQDCHPQTVASGVAVRVNSASGGTMEVEAGHVPVTDITGVQAAAPTGTPTALTATVAPSNATFKTITWSVINAGTTGAAISGNTLTTTAAGTVVVRAAIANGRGGGEAYTKDFTITVSATKYSIALDKTGTQAFPPVMFGYVPQAMAVAVSNDGNMPTGPLAVALSGADAGSFTASPASLGSLPVSGSGSFTVAPKPSLAVKAYAATVTVTGGNGISASFNVSFTVNVSTAAAITGFRSPAAATASVGNGVSSLAVDITVSPGAAWELFSDLACTRPITSKTMSLAVGDNTAYIRVTAQDGTTRAVYPLTVTRAAAPRILTTRYESNLGNWLLFIFCFGWIWMWF